MRNVLMVILLLIVILMNNTKSYAYSYEIDKFCTELSNFVYNCSLYYAKNGTCNGIENLITVAAYKNGLYNKNEYKHILDLCINSCMSTKILFKDDKVSTDTMIYVLELIKPELKASVKINCLNKLNK